ncbi:hypothetical protein CRYUN_Cryun11dG0123700 [Craigia yunnanensis]
MEKVKEFLELGKRRSRERVTTHYSPLPSLFQLQLLRRFRLTRHPCRQGRAWPRFLHFQSPSSTHR